MKCNGTRVGTIRSAADTIPFRYDTQSCTILKVSQSRIMYFNNNMNVFELICPVNNKKIVLKQNDHLCSVYRSFIHKVLVQHNKDQTQYA